MTFKKVLTIIYIFYSYFEKLSHPNINHAYDIHMCIGLFLLIYKFVLSHHPKAFIRQSMKSGAPAPNWIAINDSQTYGRFKRITILG